MDYAGILIKREDGKMLFQLRDNNPKIKNQNRWGLFGGGIKQNETPMKAAIRELKEELGLTIKKEQLKPWATFPGLKKKNYIFRLKLKNQHELKLMEGKAMGYFTVQEMRKKQNVVKSLRILLYLYPFLSRFHPNKQN